MNKVEILYEDNHLLVVNKPVNMLVQEDSTQDEDLLTHLKQYLKEKYQKPGNVYLGLVHRLDRPVGGVMVFAKTSKAASRLSDQIRKNEVEKEYLAVVYHSFSNNEGKFEDYLIKDNATNTTTVTTKEKGKYSLLSYQLISYLKDVDLSLVRIHLETGRSHQIRVQFSSRNHPLYGDQRYNLKAKPGQQIALFACQLSLIHPTTKERLTFTAKPSGYPFSLFD